MAVTEQECNNQALFLSGVDTRLALMLWVQFLWLPNIACPLLALCSYSKMRGNPFPHLSTPSRPFLGKIEQGFLETTVVLGLHSFVFMVSCLLVQVQYYCAGPVIGHGAWVTELVATILISGGFLGTTALQWTNALDALRGKENEKDLISFLKWETYVVFSPLILLGLFIILLVKSPEEYEQWEFMRVFKSWWAFAVKSVSTYIPCGDPWQYITRQSDWGSAGGSKTDSGTAEEDFIPLMEPDADATTDVASRL